LQGARMPPALLAITGEHFSKPSKEIARD
jgi:hypothetical protein